MRADSADVSPAAPNGVCRRRVGRCAHTADGFQCASAKLGRDECIPLPIHYQFPLLQTWNKFGCGVTGQILMDTAKAMVDNGLFTAGYIFVNSDDCVSFNANHPAHQKPTPQKHKPEPQPYHPLNPNQTVDAFEPHRGRAPNRKP